MSFWLWFGWLYILDMVAVVLCKAYVRTCHLGYLLVAMVAFALIIPALAKMYSHESFSVANLTWSAANIVILPLIGYLFYQDKFTVYQGVGIVLTLIGLFLIHTK